METETYKGFQIAQQGGLEPLDANHAGKKVEFDVSGNGVFAHFTFVVAMTDNFAEPEWSFDDVVRMAREEIKKKIDLNQLTNGKTYNFRCFRNNCLEQ